MWPAPGSSREAVTVPPSALKPGDPDSPDSFMQLVRMRGDALKMKMHFERDTRAGLAEVCVEHRNQTRVCRVFRRLCITFLIPSQHQSYDIGVTASGMNRPKHLGAETVKVVLVRVGIHSLTLRMCAGAPRQRRCRQGRGQLSWSISASPRPGGPLTLPLCLGGRN